MWVNTVLLRGDQVEEGLRTSIKLMQASITLLLAIGAPARVKYSEEELPMVESAVFDGIVQLADPRRIKFLLFHVAEIFE
jgi:hypothetical protein